jgi:hypothetical protein
MQDLIGPIMMFVGIGAVLYAAYTKLKVKQTLAWPSVIGTITSSTLFKKSENDSISGSANTFYGAKIVYKYTVGKRVLRGLKISAGGELNTSMPGRAEARLRKYPEGREVDVYYNPDSPARSCLERTDEISLFCAGVGALFIVVGLIL